MLSPANIIPAIAEHSRQWQARTQMWRRLQLESLGLGGGSDLDPGSERLSETHAFGSNPGKLRMFTWAPPVPPRRPALVVVLHGCTQTAAAYGLDVGWAALADRYGFVLLLPQQQRANNPSNCFNWFVPEAAAPEAASIAQMIDTASTAYGVDRNRVFVTGLSAGGAMASTMLATRPELFAGGAIIAGLPYGTASSLKEALESMAHVRPLAPREWGDLVRAASPHRKRWPRISVWHGTADTVVNPGNAVEIVKQWRDLHGLLPTPAATETVNGVVREVWGRRGGRDTIECWTLPGFAHGAPLATSGDESCGAPGPFVLDAGISSSWRIARFWGLTGDQRGDDHARAAAAPTAVTAATPAAVTAAAPAAESAVAPARWSLRKWLGRRVAGRR